MILTIFVLINRNKEMLKISEIKEKLKRGDIRDIAASVGVSTRYVAYVLDEKDERTNDLVLSAAKLIISNREKLSGKVSK